VPGRGPIEMSERDEKGGAGRPAVHGAQQALTEPD
jgi:hypothetical protein